MSAFGVMRPPGGVAIWTEPPRGPRPEWPPEIEALIPYWCRSIESALRYYRDSAVDAAAELSVGPPSWMEREAHETWWDRKAEDFRYFRRQHSRLAVANRSAGGSSSPAVTRLPGSVPRSDSPAPCAGRV